MPKQRILVVTQHFWPENFRINDMVEGFLADGLEVDVLCGLPNYPKGEWFDGYGPHGPFEEHYGAGAGVPRQGMAPPRQHGGEHLPQLCKLAALCGRQPAPAARRV